MPPRQAVAAQHQVGLLRRTGPHQQGLGGRGRRGIHGIDLVRVRLTGAEGRRDVGDQRVVVDVAGHGDGDHVRGVALAPPTGDLVARHGGHRGVGAQDLSAEGVVAVERAPELGVHQVTGVIQVHPDLLKHHVALVLHLLLEDRGRRQHVAEDVDGQRQVPVQAPRVVGRVLLGREGIHVPADGIEDLRDLQGGTALRALEQQVLQEVGGAIERRLLVPRPDADPVPHAHTANAGQVLAGHPDAVGQGGQSDAIGQGRQIGHQVSMRWGGRWSGRAGGA